MGRITFPFTPQPTQQLAAMAMAPYEKTKINGFGGPKFGGKAQPLDARILTPYGWRTMGDMEVGSKISNPDGTTQSVIQIHPQGEQQVYKITFCDGATTEATGDHLWKVRLRGKSRGKKAFKWVIADTLKLIKLLKNDKRQYPIIPLTEPVSYTKTYRKNPAKIDPYLLGLLLGDGGMSQRNSVTITTADEQIVRHIREMGYSLTYMEPYAYQFTGSKSSQLRKHLTKLGLMEKTSLKKFIPEYYKYASVEDRKNLIAGMMDTDGTVTPDGKCYYSSSSKQLALDFQDVIRSLGGRATITPKETTCNISYRVCFRTSIDPELFKLERKKKRARYHKFAPKRRIVSIEPSRKVQCQCITVSNPNRLYITDDFIVTHNSWTIQFLAALHALSRPVNVLVVGHKFEDMKSLHIEPMQRYLADYMKAGVVKYHATNKQFTVPQWGSIIKFQQVTNDSDAMDLNGQAWDIVLIDEAQKQSPFTLSYLQGICRISHTQSNWRKRLRMAYQQAKVSGDESLMAKLMKQWEDTYYSAKMLYCFNWGERGHTWLKRLFWDGCKHEGDPFLRLDKFARDESTGEFIEDPEDYRFIFAPMDGNKIGMAEDPGYVNRIRSMEEPYRSAYLTGDPNAFAGLMYEIHPHVHEVDMDELLRGLGYEKNGVTYIPDHWSLIGAIDPGTQDYCAASLYAKSPEGVSYQLTDYYVKGRSHEENAEQIAWEWRRCPWTHGRMPDYTIAGKDAFARQSKNAIFGHEYTLKDVFWDRYKIYLRPAVTDRIAGAQAVHMALSYKADENGKIVQSPKLMFAKRYTGQTDANGYKIYQRICEPTIDEIVSLESNPKRPEDIVQDGVADHAFDKTKYYLLGSRGVAQLPSPASAAPEVRDYGRAQESMEPEEADYEDISSFSAGDISSFSK